MASLSSLVQSVDQAMGRPPFTFQPPTQLVDSLHQLRQKLEASTIAGSLVADAANASEVKITLPVLATSYVRGSVDPANPNLSVFHMLIDCVVLAFPVITYTLKDLVAQALKSASGYHGTAQLLSLTKGFTKESVIKLLYGDGVNEEAVKAPTRAPPKPKKGAPPPQPWAPPPLRAPPTLVAELAVSYANNTLPADCKPFIFDIFVSHGRFAVAVADDDTSASKIIQAMWHVIRATLDPLQMLRVLSPVTYVHFIAVVEDKPSVASELMAAAQTLRGVGEQHAVNYRATFRLALQSEKAERRLGEFITAAVLCALVTRTHRFMARSDSVASLDSMAEPSSPSPNAYPITDAIPKLIVFGALGYTEHSQPANAALATCTEALAVMGAKIGKLSAPVSFELQALNDAQTRIMDVAMDSSSDPVTVRMALESAMYLVETVLFYKGAEHPPTTPLPATKHALALAANMPSCRAIAMSLTLDCNRAAGKHLRDFASVWLGHMLRTRSLTLEGIVKTAHTPLFIVPKHSKAKKSTSTSKTPPPASLSTSAPSLTLTAPQDGIRTLLLKLLTASPATHISTMYLARMVVQQLDVMGEDDLPQSDRLELLAALANVPATEVAQLIVDEVLDLEDADNNPSSEKQLLIKALLRSSVHPEPRLSHSLAVPDDDLKWMAFITAVEEAHSEATHSAAAVHKVAAAERLAAARRSQAEYEQLKTRIAQEKTEASQQREGKLVRQREIASKAMAIMEQRERSMAESIRQTKARRELAMLRVQMLLAERHRREATQQMQATETVKERRELQVSLKEYLIDTLRMDPVRVYPILSYLRTQIDSLSSDEVHEYLVTGNLSIPLDMLVKDAEEAEIVNLDEEQLKARVAQKYLRTHEGMDFWGGTIEFAPQEDHPVEIDSVAIAAREQSQAVEEQQVAKYAMSFHRRVAPVLDSFDFSHYEETGAVPPLAREAIAIVVTRAVLDGSGFSDLTDALYSCSSRGLLTVHGGDVELTPLGAAYHAPFAEADRSFQKIYEEKDEQLRRSLEAKRLELQKRTPGNAIFSE